MAGSMTPMFQSTNPVAIDESKLCFNKTHFNRPDFNIERFMNLARQKADLMTIQRDLRLYLKSVQNSMIELINDDYADFVHLSSNLVSLQESLNKIRDDIDSIWEEFEESTKDSVSTAERIENKCEELSLNREKQSELRDRIAFLSALEKLGKMLKNVPEPCTSLWLQKVASFVVELKSTKLLHSDDEKEVHEMVLSRLELVLCEEGVRSVSGDCLTFPLVLSILSLADSTHSFTAKLVSDLLYPKFVKTDSDQYRRLVDVLTNVMETRKNWAKTLGTHFKGRVRSFLDETLLTFVLTFSDKCLGNVAVPSDTRLFHKCFGAIQDFIDNWPAASGSRSLLKSIRDKFNLLIYFKLETNKFTREIENLIQPDKFAICNEEAFHCKASYSIYEAIEQIWSDEIYIASIVDKLWDFTLRMVLKHFSWAKTMQKYFNEEKDPILDIPVWKALLLVRTDLNELQLEVFDFALENIWTKLRDLDVDTLQFGNCLTKHGSVVEAACLDIDNNIVSHFVNILKKELVLVSDVPKQYRWTKKLPPTTHSGYVNNTIGLIKEFEEELKTLEHSEAESIVGKVGLEAFTFFATKAKEVQDGVEATGSSLSRFKRKNTPDGAVSDDDKIKIQIYQDASFLLNYTKNLGIDVEGLETIVERCMDTVNRVGGSGPGSETVEAGIEEEEEA